MSTDAARMSPTPLAGEAAGVPPRDGVPAPGGQGHLLWICLRTLLLFALALLPLVAGGIVLVLVLRGDAKPSVNPSSISHPSTSPP